MHVVANYVSCYSVQKGNANFHFYSIYIITYIGWVEVQWDHGGANSYRMGAEGKYDLELTGEDPAIPPPPEAENSSVSETPDNFSDEVVPIILVIVYIITQDGDEIVQRKSWDEECILKQSFSALVAAFDPRPGQTNVPQIQDLSLPVPGNLSRYYDLTVYITYM